MTAPADLIAVAVVPCELSAEELWRRNSPHVRLSDAIAALEAAERERDKWREEARRLWHTTNQRAESAEAALKEAVGLLRRAAKWKAEQEPIDAFLSKHSPQES